MKTFLPLAAWLLFLVFAGKEILLNHWEAALVVFAALALVPQGLELLQRPPTRWYWFAAAGLCVAYLFFPAKTAPLAALPYLLLSAWLTIQEAVNLLVFKKFQLRQWVRLAALAYWATGAVWAICFLADIRPLGFDPVIIGLTAAHFHVAGFVLAMAVYCLLANAYTMTNRALGWATLAGMPLVATGITLTKLGFSPVFEWVS
ncbi:MAG TPA: YndJ family transporter, partial [Saprospiraceae bacterium]|nr:YndJ family transporter [Saprospiraceae bacterium]